MKSIVIRFKKALKDKNRKTFIKMLSEYVKFKILKPHIAEQYFRKRLYRVEVENPNNYILTHELEKEIWEFNDMNYYSIFIDKYLTSLYLTKHKIPIVKTITYNINTLFFVNDYFAQVDSPSQFEKFLFDLIKKEIWSTKDIIIKKKENSWGGKDIFKLSKKDIDKNNSSFSNLFYQIIAGRYIFQNFIEQHESLNRINPNSINTIRIDTFVNVQSEVKIICTRLRTSSGQSFLDNVSKGGLFIGIDIEKGYLNTEGFTDFDKFSGKTYERHPETGTIFKGFLIPQWNEIKLLAINSAKLLPKAKVMAWDIALTPDGPLLIEGNYYPGLSNSEMIMKGFKDNPIFIQILSELEKT